jgi:hypothetical protein
MEKLTEHWFSRKTHFFAAKLAKIAENIDTKNTFKHM